MSKTNGIVVHDLVKGESVDAALPLDGPIEWVTRTFDTVEEDLLDPTDEALFERGTLGASVESAQWDDEWIFYTMADDIPG